jgi:quinolinate synthase
VVHAKLSLAQVEQLKQKVERLINLHPEWDETILARLWDFVGEKSKEIQARRAIARKVTEGTL